MQDASEIGRATLLVLPASSAHLDTDHVLLPGGARADVFVDDEGDTLVQVGPDVVTVDQLTEAVLRTPALSPRGDVVELAVVADRGHERRVLTPDLGHELLRTRRWQDRDGPHAAVVGLAPDGDDTLRAAVRLVTTLQPPAAVSVTGLFTRRGDGRIAGAPADRARDGGVRAAALAEADLVVALWGVVPPAGEWAVDDAVEDLRAARDAGTRVLVPAAGGEVRTVGQPPQPLGAAGVDADTRLVAAPSDWLWGGPLH